MIQWAASWEFGLPPQEDSIASSNSRVLPEVKIPRTGESNKVHEGAIGGISGLTRKRLEIAGYTLIYNSYGLILAAQGL